jgi:transcriptional regulator with GAF, ATPase, and Fis domain
MQSAVDHLASFVGQSVLIEDAQQRPVWWSTRGAVDRTRMRTILNRHVDPRAAAVIQQYHLTEATTPVHTPAMPEAEMWARWCMPIRYEARLLGFLWVLDPEESISETDLPALVECAELAASVMAEIRGSEHQRLNRRDELIDRLLHARDEHAARELARLAFLPSEARVQVSAPGRRGGWPLPNAMSAHVSTSPAQMLTSGSPLPLVELGEAVRRAAATRRAIAAGAHPSPVSWDGLGAWLLVVEAPESLTPVQVHPAIEALARQPRSDLMATTRVVLDHGGDVAAAAAALHIHRTTLYYRLDRIMELTGVDLRTWAARTNLQLALWLAAYRGVSS